MSKFSSKLMGGSGFFTIFVTCKAEMPLIGT